MDYLLINTPEKISEFKNSLFTKEKEELIEISEELDYRIADFLEKKTDRESLADTLLVSNLKQSFHEAMSNSIYKYLSEIGNVKIKCELHVDSFGIDGTSSIHFKNGKMNFLTIDFLEKGKKELDLNNRNLSFEELILMGKIADFMRNKSAEFDKELESITKMAVNHFKSSRSVPESVKQWVDGLSILSEIVKAQIRVSK